MNNPSILISGVSGNIGRAVAQHFIASTHSTVLGTCCHAERLQTTYDGLERWGAGLGREQLRGCAADLASDGAISDLKRWLWAEGHTPTTLVCAHGIPARQRSSAVQAWDINAVLDVNLTACLQLAQVVFPYMAEAHRGRIVFVSSIHSVQTYPERAAYAASKGGLEAMARVLALEWAHLGITVNCVAPGQLATPMHDAPISAAALQDVEAHTPVGHLPQAAQVASLVAWLCSDDAACVTGQTWRIDGGLGISAAAWEKYDE